jgi:predicted Zn-dependent protease
MSPDERAAREAQIEKHLRRGEMGEAFALLTQLAAAFPDDLALGSRLAELEQSLEPAERRRVALIGPEASELHKSPMHRAESLAASGKYVEAIAIYRDLRASRPDWDLVKERLAELFQLAQVATPVRPPVNKEGVLEHLLDRISTRKRS